MISSRIAMQTVVFDSASLPVELWTALCERDPEATVFHTAAWSLLWERARADAQAAWWILADDNGRWVGGIPLVGFSRFGITRYYSQPLGAYGGWVGEQSDICAETARAWLKGLTRPAVAELVVTPFAAEQFPTYPGRAVGRVRHTLKLTGAQDEHSWEAGIRPDVQRNLHLARRHGWRIEPVTDDDGVERTRSLWEQTALRHGRRLGRERWAFYRALAEVLKAEETLFWWTARDDVGTAGTIICLRWRDRFFYHDGARDRSRDEGRPMYALFAHAIRTAIRLGCRAFDFGSGPAEAAGLRRFKEGWGATPEPYCEYHYRKPWWPKKR